MATFKKFEEIDSWKIARELNKLIFSFTERPPLSRNFKLRDQISDAAGSVMDNIAEGFGRGSQFEFVTFLGYSTGSVLEVQSQLYRCLDCQYINKEEFDRAYEMAEIISGKNGTLIGYLNKTNIRGVRFRDRLKRKDLDNNNS